MKKLFLALTFTSLLIFNTSTVSAQTNNDGKTEALETLGATSAMLLYNTYLGIGSIADGYDKVNTKETVSVLMQEQVNGMDVIINNYDKLLKSNFLESEDDKSFLRKAIKCAGYLRTEAASYKAFLESNSKSDIEKYDTARKNAWALIEDLLGLKK
jgi:hypothetical protein